MKKSLACVLCVFSLMFCITGCGSDEFDEFDAQVVAELEVKEILKSPSTAKFSSHSQTRITNDGNVWKVTGWVDAQNGFGATIRSDYSVKFTMTGKDTYIVDYCYVD